MEDISAVSGSSFFLCSFFVHNHKPFWQKQWCMKKNTKKEKKTVCLKWTKNIRCAKIESV